MAGQQPWNKGVVGKRTSPQTEFKKGQRPGNWLPVGSETVRRYRKTSPRAFVKVAEPNVWRQRAVVVWERENGPLPRGKLVHHRDRDSLNDEPCNLQAMTRAEHIEEHRTDLLTAKAGAPLQERKRQ